MGRDLTKCHPKLQEKARLLGERCKAQGLIIGIGECFRTVQEQDILYAQGRTKPGNIVTNAKGSSYSSHHQWGTAFDIYRNDGKGAYNDTGNFFAKVGKIGKELGLEWGGDWTSPVDKPHFQLKEWGSTTSKLKSLYGNPDNFKKSWVVKKEEEEVVEKAKIVVDGKEYAVDLIRKDGLTYIKTRDFANATGYDVSNNGKVPMLTRKIR